MLPVAVRPSEPCHRKPKASPEFASGKHSLVAPLPSFAFILHHPRTWLLLFTLILQIFLVVTARSLLVRLRTRVPPQYAVSANCSPPPPSSSSSPTVVYSSLTRKGDGCPLGRFYVYDLPPAMNSDLIRNCSALSPWASLCDALSNDGFGVQASGIAGIVPEHLFPAWHATDQFASEILYHNRIMKHRCRTSDPASGSAFYIPFYAGLSVYRNLWSASSPKDRDHPSEMMLRWVQNQPYWNRSGGWDHFITLGRITWDFRRSKDGDWGSSLIYMPAMRNVTRLLIERNPWDYFDVAIPYPTGFHPSSAADIQLWQQHVRERRRSTLFSFAGAKRSAVRGDFRELLLGHCVNHSSVCRAVDCSGGTRCANGTAGSTILETFLDSDFCLQPRGDSFTRRSIFDCMVAGSIPVFFWQRTAYAQYEWFLPADRGSYSVFIHRNAVKGGASIRGVLESYNRERVREMREKVIESIPKLVYAKPLEGLPTVKDAFDIAIEGVMRRMKEQESGYKW